jgi:hypothetical protein
MILAKPVGTNYIEPTRHPIAFTVKRFCRPPPIITKPSSEFMRRELYAGAE